MNAVALVLPLSANVGIAAVLESKPQLLCRFHMFDMLQWRDNIPFASAIQHTVTLWHHHAAGFFVCGLLHCRDLLNLVTASVVFKA